MANNKLLVIGSTGYTGVASVDWHAAHLKNLADHEVVIVDVPSITSALLPALDWKVFEAIRKGVAKALRAGVRLIVVADKVHTHGKDYLQRSNYFWAPMFIGIENESGTSVVPLSEDFSEITKQITDWSFYFQGVVIGKEIKELCGRESSYNAHMTMFVENRYHRMLAGSVHYTYTIPGDKRGIDYELGEIVLLPKIPRLESREMIASILECSFGIQQHEKPPDWLDQVNIPKAQVIQIGIDEKAAEMKGLSEDIDELLEKQRELNDYKRLLYDSGTALEDLFAKCLTELGGVIKPARYSEEEFVLEYQGIQYLVECKGVSKSISLTHLRQLADYMFKFQEDEGHAGKGILFGNAWKELHPDERGQSERPIFPANVITRGEQLQVALVGSKEFFGAFVDVLDGKRSASEVMNRITSGVGVVQF